MALNLSRNTQVFVSTVNGVHTSGAGGLIAVDTISNAGSGYVAGEVITLTGGGGSGAKVVVVSVSGSGAVTQAAVMNNFRGTGHSDGQAFTQSATSGSGQNLSVRQMVYQQLLLLLMVVEQHSVFSKVMKEMQILLKLVY